MNFTRVFRSKDRWSNVTSMGGEGQKQAKWRRISQEMGSQGRWHSRQVLSELRIILSSRSPRDSHRPQRQPEIVNFRCKTGNGILTYNPLEASVEQKKLFLRRL